MLEKLKIPIFTFKKIHHIIYFCERKVSLWAILKIQERWNTLYCRISPIKCQTRIIFFKVWRVFLSDRKFSEFYESDACHFVSLEEKKLQCFFWNFPLFIKNNNKSSIRLIWESSNFLILLKMTFQATLISMVEPLVPYILSYNGFKFTNVRVTWKIGANLWICNRCNPEYIRLRESTM